MKIRTYTELMQLPTFEERFEYLRLRGSVGAETFGFDRIFNQMFYQNSDEWKAVRRDIIVRDLGHDLAIQDDDYEIKGSIYVHHMNPLKLVDIQDSTEYLLNPEYLICTSFNTHNAIHYGTGLAPKVTVVTRRKNDTCPWKH